MNDNNNDVQPLNKQPADSTEEPLLLDTDDLFEVAGGCILDCGNGSCS